MTFFAVDPGPLPVSYQEMADAILAFWDEFYRFGLSDHEGTPADLVLLSLAERINAYAARTSNAAILGVSAPEVAFPLIAQNEATP